MKPPIPNSGPYAHIPPTWHKAFANKDNDCGVSINMIVRNEAPRLARALASIIPLKPRQVIVGDTGSTDSSADIAKWFGATIVDIPWKNDFSNARNAILDMSNQDWIVWIDGDEQFAEGSAERLRERVISGSIERDYQLFRYSEYPYEMFQSRMFKRSPEARWKGRVHEQVWPDGPVQSHSDIVIFQHPDERRMDKYYRNLEMLDIAIAEDPGCYHNLLHAAILNNIVGNYEESDKYAISYLSSSSVVDLRPRVYMLYLIAWTNLFVRKDYQKAAETIISGLSMDPCAAELWCLMGDLYWWVNRKNDAYVFYENAIHFGEYSSGTFWLVDRAKYDSYPTEQIRKLESQGIYRLKVVRGFGPELP